MTSVLSTIRGTIPTGMDAFYERLRWAAAERRWQAALPTQAPRPAVPPSSPSPPQGVRLRQGAQLRFFTDAATRQVHVFQSSH
jgi:hypothetical protein